MASTAPDADKQDKRLLLIDCNALLYRAFFALPPLTTSSGIPTGGVYGFAKSLAKLITEERPTYVACAWDKGRETFRHKAWKEYKATRPETPEELIPQISYAKKVLTALNLVVLEHTNYEADDILATLALQAKKSGMQADIYTGDKDMLQLVSDSIRVIRFRKGISQTEIFNDQRVREHMDVEPSQIIDYLALVGDPSDNVPGIPGIGPKTAAKLLNKYGTIDEILAHTDELSPAIAEKLTRLGAQLELARHLVRLVNSVDLPVKLDDLRWREPNKEKLRSILEELEAPGLLKAYQHFLDDCENTPTHGHTDQQQTPSPPTEDQEHLWAVDLAREKLPTQAPLQLQSSAGLVIAVEDIRGGGSAASVQQLQEVIASPRSWIIGHDLKPLLKLLLRQTMPFEATFFDLAVAAYVLQPSEGHYELKALATRFLGHPGPELASSAARMQCMQQLYPTLKQELQHAGAWDLVLNIELPLVRVLAEMELTGIRLDPGALEKILTEVEHRREQLQREIFAATGQQFNINSPQQLSHALFDRLGLPVIRRTKTGISTSEAVLKQLAEDYPYIKSILAYRHLTKLSSTYLKPLEGFIDPETKRVHTSFSQTSTATGRLSSLQPNLQNIPVRGELAERIRTAFVAPKDCLLLSADYSQIELRILAHLSGDERLVTAFREGQDIHQETAAEIFGVLPLQVSAEMRRRAKIVNFGIVYGMSSFRLAQDLQTSQEEAAEFIARYFERYPGVKSYLDDTLRQAREQEYVCTLMGRRRYLPDIHSRNRQQRMLAERVAINSPIQGTAADLIKIAMIRIHRILQQRGIPASIILQIHDELLLETPQKYLEQVRQIVQSEMEQAMTLRVPTIVNIKTGSNWAEMAS